MPSLFTHPAHLGPGGAAMVEPAMTGPEWYAGYDARHAANGIEGRLVSLYSFTESWASWEVHPHGAEMVVCTAGSLTLHQQHADGSVDRVTLAAGDYAVNPPGTWHTADVPPGTTATALFITPGLGTDHRPR